MSENKKKLIKMIGEEKFEEEVKLLE